MKKIAIAAAALLAASATGAFAEGGKDGQPTARGPGKFIEALDTNKDGKIDAAEFAAGAAARAAKRFDAVDTDGKGVITKDQFVKAAEADAAKHFERADRDKDGSLTKEDRPPRGEHKGDGKHKGGPPGEPAPAE
jgi:Ca2+-binding EF-hand superfamily protein